MATQLQLHYTTLSLLCDLQYGRVHLYQSEGVLGVWDVGESVRVQGAHTYTYMCVL